MRKSYLLLLAMAAASSAFAAPANASYSQQILRVGTGGCPSGYTSVVNVDATHVCVASVSLSPDAYVSNGHCAAGYIEVGSGALGQWVCVTI